MYQVLGPLLHQLPLLNWLFTDSMFTSITQNVIYITKLVNLIFYQCLLTQFAFHFKGIANKVNVTHY